MGRDSYPNLPPNDDRATSDTSKIDARIADVACGFDGNIPAFENLSSPWEARRRSDPTLMQPLLSLLEKCTQEYIQANLGQIMSELSDLTPSIGKCFASSEMTSPDAFRKFSILFCTLIKQKDRLPRILALSALEEVLASGNTLNSNFFEPHDEESSKITVFSILVTLLLASDDVDILNGALQCMLRMLCAASTWSITTGEFFKGGDSSPFARLKTALSSKECRVPAVMVEGCRLLLFFASFSNGARRLKEIYPNLHKDDGLIKVFFDGLELMERGFRRVKEALAVFKRKTFFREYHVFVALEECHLVPSLNILLEMNLKCPFFSPPNPYTFLDRILTTTHGLLFLSRVPEMTSVVQSLCLLAKEEVNKKKSNFDPSGPSARSLLDRISAGWMVLSFCDKLKALRGDVEKTVAEEGVVEFLSQLHLPTVRHEFNAIIGGGHFHLLLDGVVSLKDKKSAYSDSKLQMLLFLINASLEGDRDDGSWLENSRRMYKSIKGRDLRDISGIDDSPLGCLMRDGALDTTDLGKLAGTFARNLSRMSSKGVTEDQICRLHLADFLCTAEEGRIRNSVLHALLENEFVTIVQETLKEQLKVALPRFHAGMADVAEEQSQLLRFALPAIRILDYCIDIDQKTSVLTPTLIEAMLGLLAISSHSNGQSPSTSLASDARFAIIKLLKANLFLKTTGSLPVLTVLVGKGSKVPRFHVELVELLHVMLPSQLPIPIARADLNMAAKLDEEHSSAMQLWMENISTLADTGLAHVLLSNDPSVHDKNVRLIEKILSYGHWNMADFLAWVILDYVGLALGGGKYLPKGTSLSKEIGIEEISDSEKEEEEIGIKLRASSADARLMLTFCRLVCTGNFAKSIANSLPHCDYAMSSIFSLFCRPWNKSSRQDLYQESVLEIIEAVLSSDNGWELHKHGENGRRETIVARLLKILVKFMVDGRQNPVLVGKAAEILKRVLEKDPRKKHQLVHNFSAGLFVPLLRRMVEEPTAEIKTAVTATCQILVSITPSDSGMLYFGLFSSTEPRIQPMQALLELIECDPKEPYLNMEIVSQLYTLAALGVDQEGDFSLFPGLEPVAADPPAVQKFLLVDTGLQAREEQPAEVEKSRRNREARAGRRVAGAVSRHADQQSCEAVEGVIKSMESINKKKISPAPGLKFE